MRRALLGGRQRRGRRRSAAASDGSVTRPSATAIRPAASAGSSALRDRARAASELVDRAGLARRRDQPAPAGSGSGSALEPVAERPLDAGADRHRLLDRLRRRCAARRSACPDSSSSASGLPPVASNNRAATSGAIVPGRSSAAEAAASSPPSTSSGSSPPSPVSPLRAASSSTTPSSWSRRATNTSASRDGASSHGASSTATRTGARSPTAASRLSVGGVEREAVTGHRRAERERARERRPLRRGSEPSSDTTGPSRSARPAKESSDSDSTPRARSTVIPSAAAIASSSSALLPIPGSPRITSAALAPRAPPRAAPPGGPALHRGRAAFAAILAWIHRSSVDASASWVPARAIGRADLRVGPLGLGRSTLGAAHGGEAPRESVDQG